MIREAVVIVEYLVPDSHKDVGKYRVKTGMVGGESIRVNRIVRIEGELFAGEF